MRFCRGRISIRAECASNVLRKGVRGVPPLITAVVVVFVTSDAWRILGTGFTARFAVLVVVFLLASLLFLIRWNCWDDIDAKPQAAEELLAGIKGKHHVRFRKFIDRGAEPVPIVRPRILGTIWVYTGYWMLCAFALVIAALFVSGALIIIGVILISRNETMALANSVYVYKTLPGGAVITKQLLSLSFSLGAFAAFFLVAAQQSSDRKAFMTNVLRRYRRDLLVYSIYCRAHDRAAGWTLIPVDLRPLDHRHDATMIRSVPTLSPTYAIRKRAHHPRRSYVKCPEFMAASSPGIPRRLPAHRRSQHHEAD